MLDIRLANPSDADAIASIHAQAWPDEHPQPGWIERVLAHPENRAHVAIVAGTPVGYVDGFMTRGLDGSLRWEIDLLAVSPRHQGRGTAIQLIIASLQAGSAMGAGLARALIHEQNIASQKAFQACDFSFQQSWLNLYTLTVAEEVLPENIRQLCVSVETINYHGFWLDGNISIEMLEAAARLSLQGGDGVLGVLLPPGKDPLQLSAVGFGFSNRGCYAWWHYPLRDGYA